MTGYDIARPEDVQHTTRDKQAAMAFLASYREPTRSLYGVNLRQWFDWCELRGMPPLTASRSHIEVWLRELEERQGLMLSTVNNKASTVIAFYRNCVRDGYREDNPAEFLRRPKVSRQSTTNALTRRELTAVWELAKESEHSCDVILVGLLAFLGLRVGEAVALNLEDVFRQGSYIMLKVRREKGNRDGSVPLPMPMMQVIDRTLRYRTTGPLLLMRGGERMDRKAAGRVIARLVKKAGIAKRITPHSFRHTFITLSHDAGVNPREIQHSLGYSDLRMISYYDRGGADPSRHAGHSVASYIEAT